MHILTIIHGYPPHYNAGSEVYSQSICNELSKQHKVSVFTREENPYSPDFQIRKGEEIGNLTLFFVNMAQGKDGFRHEELDNSFAKFLAELKPDIAHIGHLNHLSTGIIDVLNNQGIPIVFTLHDFWLMCPRGQFLQRNVDGEKVWQLCQKQDNYTCATTCYKPYLSGIKNKMEIETEYWTHWIADRMEETRSIINKVNLFIAPSHYLRNRFITEFAVPEDKIVYLDYGFPTEYLSPCAKKTEKKVFTFGYIGTFIPSKGVNLLIEAFKKLEMPCELQIWGHKDKQSYAALKKLDEDSPNPIHFKGEYINQHLANEVFSQVDCIVVPSIWGENSPLVIHEAQACKVPVITADFGGMKEYVQHEVNGLLFEHRSVASLIAQMRFSVENPALLQKMGERGYILSPNGEVPNIETHCNELLTKNYGKVYNGLKINWIYIIGSYSICNCCRISCICSWEILY